MQVRNTVDQKSFPAPAANASPDYGCLYIDDATGVVLSTPTTSSRFRRPPAPATSLASA